jgi:multiple sugar transport system ATP-binding protein
LSNLDANLRVQMRAEISRIQRELGVTTLYVTHDQVEAMTMGDRVAVIQGGVLQQVDSPQKLYDNPDNLFVAGFIGSPPMNFAMATIERDETGTLLAVLGQDITLPIPEDIPSRTSALGEYVGRRVVLGVRAEDLTDTGSAPTGGNGGRFKASVVLTEALGSETVVHLRVPAEPLTARNIDTATAARLQGTAALRADADQATFIARFGPRSSVRPDETIEISIDVQRLHFFDPDHGAAIR